MQCYQPILDTVDKYFGGVADRYMHAWCVIVVVVVSDVCVCVYPGRRARVCTWCWAWATDI